MRNKKHSENSPLKHKIQSNLIQKVIKNYKNQL